MQTHSAHKQASDIDRKSRQSVAESAAPLSLGLDLQHWQPHSILALQRSVGNQVVQRMIASRVPDGVQPKLTVGPVSDEYEAEADRIATQVSRQIAQPSTTTAPPNKTQRADDEQIARQPLSIQRFAGPSGGTLDVGLERNIMQARGGGKLLDGTVRRQMEGNFGQSFTDVRVHTDQRADQLNRSLSARAFTTGKDIFFKRGEYTPHSSDGQHLLAHELTHVVQQNGGAVQRWPWSKKKKKNKDKNPKPYNMLTGKFMGGHRDPVNKDLLSEAQESAGTFDSAMPDYSNPELAGAEPDSYEVTVAVAQEEAGWWDTVKRIKKIGLKKLFQSPRKLIRGIKAGEAEEYLLGKMLKYDGKLPTGTAQQAEAIEQASDLFHSVGHTWVRLTSYVGGVVKDHYSYGFWPRKIGHSGGYSMTKYVPGQVRHPDTVHEGDAMKRYFTKSVGFDAFATALALAQDRFDSPPAYHLLDYNCTKFAREILKAAGGSFPGKGVFPSIGYSPGQLFSVLGKQSGKEKTGEQIHDDDTDSMEGIISSVTSGVEERQSEWAEKMGLTPHDPKDYPAGIYRVPIVGYVQFPASMSEANGPLDENFFFGMDQTEAVVYVKDDLTTRYGRAYVEESGIKHYFRIERMLQPGMAPSERWPGDEGDHDDTASLPEMLGGEEARPLIEAGEWSMIVDFGYVFPDNLRDLTDRQYQELAKITGRDVETLRTEIEEFLNS